MIWTPCPFVKSNYDAEIAKKEMEAETIDRIGTEAGYINTIAGTKADEAIE